MESNTESVESPAPTKKDSPYDQWLVVQNQFEAQCEKAGWMVMHGASADLLAQYRDELQALHAAKETLAAILDAGEKR